MISASRKVSSTCRNHVCWGKRGKIYKQLCKKWFFKVSKFVYFRAFGPTIKKKKKFWIFFVKNIFLEKIFLTKSFVNFSPFSPANMVPASGGHLSEGWNHAGLFSFDLILSELLLEHDIFKIDFISWAPSGEVWQYPHPCPWPIACGHTRDGPGTGGGLLHG